LVIAHYGYRPDLSPFTSSRTAFFPLYPLGLSALTAAGLGPIVAGVAISLGALLVALYGIHRLTVLELGLAGVGDDTFQERVAKLAVWATALAPMAFFFSAVYSESLYLALSVGLFWCARKGHWAAAGALGGLAAATRSAGVVLLVPALVIYFYSPRERGHGERPTRKVGADLLWLALVPAGLCAYLAYLAAAGGDPLTPFHVQQVWDRHLTGPFVAVWNGAEAAFAGAKQLVGGGHVSVEAGHNLILFAFLAGAIVAVVGVFRRLPVAYGAYVVCALALPLSTPASTQPLMSLPRFLVVLFPLNMWLGLVLAKRPKTAIATLLLSGASMAVFGAEFATWHWVA
jgi:hypothetical protein